MSIYRKCSICNCAEADNKCKNCKYCNDCDYFWIQDVWKEGGDLLTPLMPAWVKEDIKKGKVLTVTGKFDFCVINIPKTSDYITIQDICVSQKARGQGVVNELFNALMTTYDRHILAKCVKGTSAESFWSHLGTKISEEQSKKRVVCTYWVNNTHKQRSKVDLFNITKTVQGDS